MGRDRRSVDQQNQSTLACAAAFAAGYGGILVAKGIHLPKPWWWMLVPLAGLAAVLCWRWYGAAIRRAKADGDPGRLEKVRVRVWWAAWALVFGSFGLVFAVITIEKLLEQPSQTLPISADEPVERGNP